MLQISTTTALRPFVDFSKIPPAVLEAAAVRGSGVHAACAAIASDLFYPEPPADYQGYIESFRQWFDSYVKRVIFAEERFVDGILLYNGKPDLGVELIDGKLFVVDLKTPAAEAPTWKAQLASYLHLVIPRYPFDWGCMSLRLDRDGKPAKAIIYKNSDADFRAFIAALTAYRYFKS